MTVLGVIYDSFRPAWQRWQPGQQIDPYEVPDELIDNWTETGPGKPGYNSAKGCYCWGFRPPYQPMTLDGRRWDNQLKTWKICKDACSTPVCPVCPSCGQSGSVAPCPECPTCVGIQAIDRNKNWLWLAGFGALVVGVYGVRRTIQLKKK